MALLLKDIYELTRHRFQLQLLAGQEGLHNCMRWVYVSEDYSTANFLHGGELIITTGVISGGSSAWLLRLLRHIIPQHTCGLIVNEGPYLRREQISQEILDFCDQHAFPLFLMPWHIHIYDITRDYCDRIFTDTRQNDVLRQCFLTLLKSEGDQAKALSLLEDHGFPQADCYFLVLFSGAGEPLSTPLLYDRLSSLTGTLSFPTFLFSYQDELLLLCRQRELPLVCQTAKALQAQLQAHCPPHLFPVGIGGACHDLSTLSRSLLQAQAALSWGISQESSLACYDQMGFARLLLEVHNRPFLQAYVQELLGPVLAYDQAHDSDLAHTLHLYLIYRGSLQAVAATAFCHRNTVSHRLHILQDKLGYRLEDPDLCFQLMAAFQIQAFLAL